MSPRILDTRRCPHCKADLPDPTPRTCPVCGGSLQQRFLKLGCLTTAPKLFVIGLIGWVLHAVLTRWSDS